MTETRRSRLSRGRLYAFSAFTTVAVLFGLNQVVEFLEGRGLIETLRPGDYVQHVDDAIFERDGDHWEKTEYARRTMVRGGFGVDLPEFRAFILGGSFAMGGPFADPTTGEERPGTPATWLRGFLELGAPALDAEVINTGAMGQDSHRVRRVAELVLEHEPDVLVVASCNNEAWMPEGEVREALRGLGGYRLLDRLLRPTPEARPRLHTATENEEVLRNAYEQNLRTVVRDARARNVKVLLATVPINLRYEGLEREAAWQGLDLANADCLSRGISLIEMGNESSGREVLSTCAEAPEAELWTALADLRIEGRTDDLKPLESALGACVASGVNSYYSSRYDEAIATLEECDNVHEALRWIGLSRLALGQIEEARDALTTSVDLFPRNRCRPDFNEVVRTIASEEAGVVLVDLDQAVRAAAPDGLPGAELFVDVCHMTRWGYGIVAETVWEELTSEGLVTASSRPTLDEVAARLEIDEPRSAP